MKEKRKEIFVNKMEQIAAWEEKKYIFISLVIPGERPNPSMLRPTLQKNGLVKFIIIFFMINTLFAKQKYWNIFKLWIN